MQTHIQHTHIGTPKFRFTGAYSSRKPCELPAVAEPQVWVTMKLGHVSFLFSWAWPVSDEVTYTLYSEGSLTAI